MTNPKSARPGGICRAVLDVTWRPEALGGSVVALVKRVSNAFEHDLDIAAFGAGLVGVVHGIFSSLWQYGVVSTIGARLPHPVDRNIGSRRPVQEQPCVLEKGLCVVYWPRGWSGYMIS